jgi:hypothetical protein
MDNYIQDRTTGGYFIAPVLIIDLERDEVFRRMELVEGHVLRTDTFTITDFPDGTGSTMPLYAAVLLVMTDSRPAPYAEADRYRAALVKLGKEALVSRHFSAFNDHTVVVVRAALEGKDVSGYTL